VHQEGYINLTHNLTNFLGLVSLSLALSLVSFNLLAFSRTETFSVSSFTSLTYVSLKERRHQEFLFYNISLKMAAPPLSPLRIVEVPVSSARGETFVQTIVVDGQGSSTDSLSTTKVSDADSYQDKLKYV
jgi:hypothetical protein